MLDQLTPGQRQMLMAGVPVVAVFALLASRKKAAAAGAPVTTTTPVVAPSNAVLGADALSSFMDQISSSIGYLQSELAANQPPAASPTVDAVPVAPAVIDQTPTPPTAVMPADQYRVGQSVAPGEAVVASAYSPTSGWLNLTSKGGIYTGGGGAGQPISGSYLGYAAGTADPAAELAAHGDFAHGSITVLPGGGFVEKNTTGETYQFGS